MIQGGFVQQVSFFGFSTWITYHARGASYKCKGLMTCFLKVNQEQDRYQAADVEAVSCGVKTNISGGHLPGKLVFGTGRDILDHAPPFQFCDKRHNGSAEFW